MAHLYTYTCTYMILCFKNIYETVSPLGKYCRFYLPLYLFLRTIHLKLFHFLQVEFFISFDISKTYVMLYVTSQSSPDFHSFFNKAKTSAETATKLDFISSIWDYDYIMRLNEKNWQCLLCNHCFQ